MINLGYYLGKGTCYFTNVCMKHIYIYEIPDYLSVFLSSRVVQIHMYLRRLIEPPRGGGGVSSLISPHSSQCFSLNNVHKGGLKFHFQL